MFGKRATIERIFLAVLVIAVNFSSSMMRRSVPLTASAFSGVRIVSYNVLSSHLSEPSHFSTLDPEHLLPAYRLPLVFQKLEEEIARSKSSSSNSSSKSVVICLQELSTQWAGDFHTWFANRGYHFVTGQHGNKFNGYMGVAVAYPMDRFETLGVDISRLSDHRVGGWPREPPAQEITVVGKLRDRISNLIVTPLKLLGLMSNARPKEDHWALSKRRFNILVSTTLRDKQSGQAFCVGNYHMPCAYYMPMAMTLHSEMAFQHIQNIAAAAAAKTTPPTSTDEEGTTTSSIPYIMAGDWNLTPDSSQYKMLTTGTIDRQDPAYPTPKHGMEFTMNAAPMRSAYAAAAGDGDSSGKEPDFTNYARVKEDEPFIDTLDYIFLSPEWKVTETKSTIHRTEAKGPYPNALEPSDHILISADLEL